MRRPAHTRGLSATTVRAGRNRRWPQGQSPPLNSKRAPGGAKAWSEGREETLGEESVEMVPSEKDHNGRENVSPWLAALSRRSPPGLPE
jgi:hypothetical protein